MNNTDTATPKLYIGLDIHKRSWKFSLATDLFIAKSFTTDANPEGIKSYVDKYYPDHEVHIAYESGCCGFEPQRAFASFGWHSLVVNPADIAKSAKAKFQKTDKIDARMICRELKDNRLRCIHIPDKQREQLRCLFRRRAEMVKKQRAIKTRIKMQLLYLGIKIPKEYDNSHWSHKFRDWIRALRADYTTVDYTMETRMAEYEFVDKQIREISNELRAYCRKHYKKDYNLLRSIPGIGGIVACGILSELGDLRRFKSLKQLAGYVGLCPMMHQSGDKSGAERITPIAHRLMRSYFVEASWQALRFDPVMQAYYRSHIGKDSKKILIKVARKLLSRTLAVIKTETPYAIGVVK